MHRFLIILYLSLASYSEGKYGWFDFPPEGYTIATDDDSGAEECEVENAPGYRKLITPRGNKGAGLEVSQVNTTTQGAASPEVYVVNQPEQVIGVPQAQTQPFQQAAIQGAVQQGGGQGQLQQQQSGGGFDAGKALAGLAGLGLAAGMGQNIPRHQMPFGFGQGWIVKQAPFSCTETMVTRCADKIEQTRQQILAQGGVIISSNIGVRGMQPLQRISGYTNTMTAGMRGVQTSRGIFSRIRNSP